MLQPVSPQLKSHSHSFTFRDKLLPKTTCLSPPICFTSRQKEAGTHRTGLSGPFHVQVPGWGVQAQNSKCMGKHMRNAAADLILTLITTSSFPHHSTSWRPWPSRKEKSAESIRKRTSGYGKVKVIPWGRKLNPLPLCWGGWKKDNFFPLCLDSHHLCYWILQGACSVWTGRAKSSSFYSNWCSDRLRTESSFWPLAI